MQSFRNYIRHSPKVGTTAFITNDYVTFCYINCILIPVIYVSCFVAIRGRNSEDQRDPHPDSRWLHPCQQPECPGFHRFISKWWKWRQH